MPNKSEHTDPRCALVVGANRGIGLELSRQLAARGERVLGTTRDDAPELAAIDGVEVHRGVDVTDDDSIERLAGAVGDHRIDLLIVVSGVMKRVTLEEFDRERIRTQFEVNALGVLSTTVRLLKCLKDGAKIGLITSRMGSIADNTSGGSYGYRMSKAALNMAGRSLSIDLRPREIAVAILHPGWVRTDMTSGQGLIDADESASGLLQRLDELNLETSGEFYHQSGEHLPW